MSNQKNNSNTRNDGEAEPGESDDRILENSVKICTTCNKRIVEGGSSLTQWIFSYRQCSCNLQDQEFSENLNSIAPISMQPLEVQTETSICRNCGKRIVQRSEGSITQWIFQSHKCSCGAPAPIIASISEEELESTEFAVPESLLSLAEGEDLSGWISSLDRYVPIKKLGHGATGFVFLCFDKVLQKSVAVKCLASVNNETIVSFQREAKSASKLSHESIVRVIDFGTAEGGLPYMVLEYIDGVSLASLIENNSGLSVENTLLLARKLSAALAHAHSQTVFHRDIKSTNIMITQDRNGQLLPVLIDFGVAKFKEDTLSEQSDTLVGSVSYMAPDYIDSGKYNQRSEIYSLGIVLYECLTGNVPFIGSNSIETIMMHKSSYLPTISEARKDLDFPVPVEVFINRCVARDPEERFETMLELESFVTTLEIDDRTSIELPGDQLKETERPNFSFGKLIGFMFCSLAGASVMAYFIYAEGNNSQNKASSKNSELEVKDDSVDLVYSLGLTPISLSEINQILSNYKTEKSIKVRFRMLDSAILKKVAQSNKVEVDFRTSKFSDNKALKYFCETRLEHIALNDTNFNDDGCIAISSCSKLKYIDLPSTLVSDKGVESLTRIKGLVSIDLGETKITDTSLESISRLHSLTNVELNNTQISDTGLLYLRKLTSLRLLTIKGCSNVTSQGIGKLQKALPNCKIFYQ